MLDPTAASRPPASRPSAPGNGKAPVVQSSVRIVVADAHPLFALGVRSMLEAEPRLRVVAEATLGDIALRHVEQFKPDILLLDLALDGMSGLDVLDRLAMRKLPTRTVVISTEITAADLRKALIAGARGVLEKRITPALFVKCIRQVMAGEFWIGRNSVADLVEALRNPSPTETPASNLSQRERDIVNAVVKGSSNKDVAWQLGVSEQTVKNHLRRIFSKLRVANRVELAVRATTRLG